ncbi:aspartic proteinase PCS1-like [Aristolochia californica]|uniref:aspartic proteinase PCS1-like n=1 Tax=Aristolochia californica TaxID=171875 RepID=UPI0035D7BAC2
MASVLPLLLFCLLLKATSVSSQSLVLPLRTEKIQLGSPRNSLLIRYNVSLTVSLAVGTPPRKVSLVFDTGSELSWVRCGKSFTASFDPSLSSTYSRIPCSSQICKTKTRDFPIPASCAPDNLCHVQLSYADASTSEGTLATETFRIGGTHMPGTVFGCMDSTFSSHPEEDSKSAGLLGMNRGSSSFVSQTRFPKFSYCISSHDFSGVLVFGNSSFPWLAPLNYTPLIQMSLPLPYFDRVAYSVQLVGIRVKEKLLPLPKSVFVPDHTGAGQTMVDSGTQFTFLLGPAYTALRNEFVEQSRGFLKVLPGFVFEGALDLCFSGSISETSVNNVPEVVLMFRGAEISISGERLLYRVSDRIFCFTFGNSDLVPVEAYIIGHHHQRDTWVEYDLQNSRVGFGKARCDLVGQRLGMPSK